MFFSLTSVFLCLHVCISIHMITNTPNSPLQANYTISSISFSISKSHKHNWKMYTHIGFFHVFCRNKMDYSHFFLLFILIDLKGRVTEKEESSTPWLIPKCSQQPGLGQAKAKSLEFQMDLVHSDRDPSHSLLPPSISRKLDQKLSSWESHWLLHKIQASQTSFTSSAWLPILAQPFFFSHGNVSKSAVLAPAYSFKWLLHNMLQHHQKLFSYFWIHSFLLSA